MKAVGVTFTEDDEKRLTKLYNARNDIAHHEWHADHKKEARGIVGDALSFAFSFADEHLGTDLAAEFKRDDTWSALIEESPAFILAHGARIEAKLRAKGKYPSHCDNCGQQTVPMDGGSFELCGHWQDVT